MKLQAVAFGLILVKVAAGVLAGLWLLMAGSLFEANDYGIPAAAPWAVSAKLGLDAVRCWRSGDLAGRLLAGLWGLAAAAFANRTLRDAGIPLPGIEWILVAYVPALIFLRVMGAMVASRTARARRAGRWAWAAICSAPVALVTASGWVPVAAGLLYGSILAGAGSSSRLMR